MTRSLPRATRAPARALALTLLACAAAHAQDSTRIVAATLYPDSATVVRELKVPGGTRHVEIACVPGGVDLATLQVDGDPELRLGDVHVDKLSARRRAVCDGNAFDDVAADAKRETALEERIAQLKSRQAADEIALGYLRQWGTHGGQDGAPATPAAPQPRPASAAEALRQAALDLLADQDRVKRDADSAQGDLDDLRMSGRYGPQGKGGWRAVRFDVWTPAAATLRVRYLAKNAHWTPTYRVLADVAHGTVRLDRQADIAQDSGEDWKDVRIVLSTGHASGDPAGQAPTPWFLDLAGPPRARPASLPGGGEELQRVEVTGSSIRPEHPPAPDWIAAVQQGAYATEFVLAQPQTFASDDGLHAVTIESRTLPVTFRAHATPGRDSGVYLVAEAERPAGVWPPGQLLALRDGAMVGRTAWQPAQGERMAIPLGRDDLMSVKVETAPGFTSATGLFDSRTERSSKAAYAITNRHTGPVTLEVLEPAPVSRNERITVRSTYDPAPTTLEWNHLPGVVAWSMALAPGQTQRIAIAHVVSFPKDETVRNLP